MGDPAFATFFGGDPEISEQHNVYHYITKEFVEALVKQINKLNIEGNIVEIAAGNGKLSYWLNKYGIKVSATDIRPKSNEAEEMSALEALRKYKPKLVIASWLPPTSEIGKKILDFESVEAFIYIENNHGGHSVVDRSARNSERLDTEEHLVDLEPFSIPTNLLEPYYNRSSNEYRRKGLEKMGNKRSDILNDKFKKTVFVFRAKC